MKKSPSLGWQSWSPPYPHPLHFPRRDYPPRASASKQPPHLRPPLLKFNYWCSWYALGYFPRAKDILTQAKLIRQHSLPIDYILIDDGWQESWLADLSRELHSLGFKVGLWFAPYTRHRNLPTLATLTRLIETYRLDLLKLDFLYKPYFDPLVVKPEQLLQNLFKHLSVHYPSLFTIACGAPFSDSINHVSAIRVSKDTALPYPTPHLLNKYFYAHRVSLLNQKYQAWLTNPNFIPDPDVRMFTLDSIKTYQLWEKMNFGVKGIGDNLVKLPPSHIQSITKWLKQ